MGQKSSERSTLVILFVYLILDLFGFTIILPLLPSILDSFAQRKDGWYLRMFDVVVNLQEILGIPNNPRWNSVLFGGILGSLFCMLQFLSSPVIGSLSDYLGRKPLLILMTLGMCASYAMWAASTIVGGASFLLFILSRVVGGMSRANIGVASAVVSDVSSTETRGHGMALIGIAFSLAFLIGPLAGVALTGKLTGSFDARHISPVPPILALGLCILDLFLLVVLMPETMSNKSSTMQHSLKQALNLINPVSLFAFSPMTVVKHKLRDLMVVRRLGLVYFVYLLIYSGLEFNLTFLTHIRFSYNSMDQGRMFFLMGLIMIATQGCCVRRLAPGSEKRTCLMGMSVLILAFLLIGLATTALVFWLGVVLFSLASATVIPTLTTLVSLRGDPQLQGRLLGILRSLGALARAIGPLLASVLFWCIGPSVTYMTGALAMVVPCIVLYRLEA